MKQKSILHLFILLGLIIVGRFAVVIWFYAAIFFYLNKSFSKEGFSYNIAALFLYLIPLELLSRILGANPFVPYEAGKYVTFALLLFCLFRLRVKKGKWLLPVLLLLIPGLLMVNPQESGREIVFNLMGIVNMCLGAMVFSNMYISSSEVKQLVTNSIYSLLVLLFYLIILSPDLSSVSFDLAAVSDVTGDFGSNQASTVLGYGVVLFIFLFLRRWKFSGYYLLDQALLLLLALWSLLSFSRGGMIGALLAVLGILGVNVIRRRKDTGRKLKLSSVVVVTVALIGSFYLGNLITGGALLQRYQGETASTLRGTREKGLAILTTGRSEIFFRDVSIFSENPILGVGVGNAKVVGEEKYDNAKVPHIEVSRLIAEHGILGIAVIVMIFIYPFMLLSREKNMLKRNWMIALLIISLFSTMHAATRTMISPILFGLAFINIKDT